jgi:hypothetical protein
MINPVKSTPRTLVLASTISGAPSTLAALIAARGDLRRAARTQLGATKAIGTLLPPGTPSLARGALAHVIISVAMAELVARVVDAGDRRRGAAVGLLMGLVNVAVIGRRYPAIRALPLVPQLADNIAFGLIAVGQRT